MRTRSSAAPSRASDHRVGGAGRAPARRAHGHLLAVDGVAADGRVDRALRAARARPARRPGTPSPPCAPRTAGQGAVRLVVLGHHHQAGGAAVEAVDDAGPQHAAHARRGRGTWWSSALTSVPAGRPAPGWTTRPAGLSITSRRASSWTIASGMSSGGGRRRPGLGHVDRDRLRPRAGARRRARRARPARTAPSSISACSARPAQLRAAGAASQRSSRAPASGPVHRQGSR